LQREFFLACGLEALLEVAKDTHDVTSLDTWSRRRIIQSMLAATGYAVAVYPPEPFQGLAPRKLLPMTRAPVYRLSPVLDGLRLRIVAYLGGKGEIRN
jgi:hypothetical protein